MAILSLVFVAFLLFPAHIGFIGIIFGTCLLSVVVKQRMSYQVQYKRTLTSVLSVRRRTRIPSTQWGLKQAKHKAGKFRKASVFRL